MNIKKFGLLLVTGMLLMTACGEEQSASNVKEEVAEQNSKDQEKTGTGAMEEKTEEDSLEGNTPEAISGAASDLLSNGEMTNFVFNETGEYSIYCEPHPVMQMTVLVEEGAEQMDKVTVNIADYKFSKEIITVPPGTTIVWTNQDQAQHNVAIK